MLELDGDVLGANAGEDGAPAGHRHPLWQGCAHRRAAEVDRCDAVTQARDGARVRRLDPDDGRHGRVGRPVEHLLRGSSLPHTAVDQQDDAVAESQRLRAVVRDHHRRDALLHEDLPQFGPKRGACGSVECGQRLVQQQQVGARGQGPGECHTLGLAAGQLPHWTVAQMRSAGGDECLIDTPAALAPRYVAEPVCDVALDTQMREQRMVLEQQSDPTLARRHADRAAGVPVARSEADVAAVESLESGEAAQHSGLA